MTTGEEKTVLTVRSVVRYLTVKFSLLGIWMIWVYVDPTWFSTGITYWVIIWLLGVMCGIDFLMMIFVFVIKGIYQEHRVRK